MLIVLQEIRAVKAQIGTQPHHETTLEQLLDVKDVAKLLGVESGYVYSQAAGGKIPSFKFGKYRKFSPSQLKKWLDRTRA